ncbi:MAG: hypothetical protein ACYC91_17780 [Solirubrobacteraceae bacterium]
MLTCIYDSRSPFLSATGADHEVSIVVSALTGKPGRESLAANVSSFAPDLKPANNRSVIRLEVRR